MGASIEKVATVHAKTDELRCLVRKLINSGSMIAIGGQNALRNPVALALEISRQKIDNLTLVGCNLSLAADVLVGSGLVSKLVCGTINFEVFGVPKATCAQIEAGTVVIADHDHHTIITRLIAGQLALPFVPLADLGDTDWMNLLIRKFPDEFTILDRNPFTDGQVVVAKPLCPDVCLLHVQCADDEGNLYVLGPECSDYELAMASGVVIATCEQILPSAQCRRMCGNPILPGSFVTSIAVAPGAAHPCATPGYYGADGARFNQYNDQVVRSKFAPFAGAKFLDRIRGDFEKAL